MDDGLRSRNKIKVYANQEKFTKKGTKLRSMDNSIKISINGRTVIIDDIDIDLGSKPHIRIYGDIEFLN